MEEVTVAGRTAGLFELEMWLRSFERFFRIKNQPLSQKETKQLAIRNWLEELRLVDSVLLRTIQLCTAILTEEQVNVTQFDKYVESYLKKDEVVDPYIERMLRQSTPEASLNLLKESFEDIHVLLLHLSRLARVPYPTFTAVGKVLYREIRRSPLLALLIDKKFKPIHDRISNPAIARLIHGVENRGERKHAAKVFLELFRLLHYLEYADPERNPSGDFRGAILIFSLITSEARLLTAYLERRVLRETEAGTPLFEVYDGFVYCLPLELKKVINTELLDISVAQQSDGIRARVENSHGILKDCFQQSVVQLAQMFDPQIDGQSIFSDYMAKLVQSGAEAGLLGVLRREHEASHVPRLVGLRAVLHRDPEVQQPHRVTEDRPPVRDLPRDALPRGPEADGAPGCSDARRAPGDRDVALKALAPSQLAARFC